MGNTHCCRLLLSPNDNDSDDGQDIIEQQQLPNSSNPPLPLINDGAASPYWHKDKEHDRCELCNIKFSFFTRRHHCRLEHCGKVLCGHCTDTKRVRIVSNQQKKTIEVKTVRVCKKCSPVMIGMMNGFYLAPNQWNEGSEQVFVNFLQVAYTPKDKGGLFPLIQLSSSVNDEKIKMYQELGGAFLRGNSNNNKSTNSGGGFLLDYLPDDDFLMSESSASTTGGGNDTPRTIVIPSVPDLKNAGDNDDNNDKEEPLMNSSSNNNNNNNNAIRNSSNSRSHQKLNPYEYSGGGSGDLLRTEEHLHLICTNSFLSYMTFDRTCVLFLKIIHFFALTKRGKMLCEESTEVHGALVNVMRRERNLRGGGKDRNLVNGEKYTQSQVFRSVSSLSLKSFEVTKWWLIVMGWLTYTSPVSHSSSEITKMLQNYSFLNNDSIVRNTLMNGLASSHNNNNNNTKNNSSSINTNKRTSSNTNSPRPPSQAVSPTTSPRRSNNMSNLRRGSGNNNNNTNTNNIINHHVFHSHSSHPPHSDHSHNVWAMQPKELNIAANNIIKLIELSEDCDSATENLKMRKEAGMMFEWLCFVLNNLIGCPGNLKAFGVFWEHEDGNGMSSNIIEKLESIEEELGRGGEQDDELMRTWLANIYNEAYDE